MPTLITMSIAATRMYRSLADFCSVTDMYSTLLSHYSARSPCLVYRSTSGSEGPQRIGHTAPNARSTSNIPISYSQVEVAVHTSYEQYPGLQTDQHASYINVNGQMGHKPRGLSFDDDLESRRGEMKCRVERPNP